MLNFGRISLASLSTVLSIWGCRAKCRTISAIDRQRPTQPHSGRVPVSFRWTLGHVPSASEKETNIFTQKQYAKTSNLTIDGTGNNFLFVNLRPRASTIFDSKALKSATTWQKLPGKFQGVYQTDTERDCRPRPPGALPSVRLVTLYESGLAVRRFQRCFRTGWANPETNSCNKVGDF